MKPITLKEEIQKYASILNEAWDTEMHTREKDKGMFKGRSIDSLKAELKKLKDTPNKTEAVKKREHQITFAIRAKQKDKFGKIKEDFSTEPIKRLFGRDEVSKLLNLADKYENQMAKLELHRIRPVSGPNKYQEAIDRIEAKVKALPNGSERWDTFLAKKNSVDESKKPSSTPINESLDKSLDDILVAHKDEVQQFIDGEDLSYLDDLYNALYEYYREEMPYGTQKARTGDPYNWITDKLSIYLSDHGYMDDDAEQVITNPENVIDVPNPDIEQCSMIEQKKPGPWAKKNIKENSWTHRKCKECNKVLSAREVGQPEPKSVPLCSSCKKKRTKKNK